MGDTEEIHKRVYSLFCVWVESGIFVHLDDEIFLIRFQFQLWIQKGTNVKGIGRVCIHGEAELGMTGQVVFVRQEGADTPEPENTFVAVHHRQFID